MIFESHAESAKWHGAMATMDVSPDDHIWGAVYRMDKDDLDAMDRSAIVISNKRNIQINLSYNSNNNNNNNIYLFDMYTNTIFGKLHISRYSASFNHQGRGGSRWR